MYLDEPIKTLKFNLSYLYEKYDKEEKSKDYSSYSINTQLILLKEIEFTEKALKQIEKLRKEWDDLMEECAQLRFKGDIKC